MACIGCFKLAFFIVTVITMSQCYLFYFVFSLSQNFTETLIYKYCRILGKIQRTLEINYATEIQSCYFPEVCFKCLLYYWWYPLTWCIYKSSICSGSYFVIFYFIMLTTQKIILQCNNIVQQKNTIWWTPQHLKVKVKDISLSRNCCITISIQKNQLNS